MLNTILYLLLISNFFNQILVEPKVDVALQVTNIRNNEGILKVAIFYDDESFQSEETAEYIILDKSNAENGVLNATIQLPVGECGLSSLDDENENDKMDYNWMGIPQEGYGFSDFEHTGWSKPHYEDFKIEIHPAGNQTIKMKMRYL